MKTHYTRILLLIAFLAFQQNAFAQTRMWHQEIAQTNIDLDGPTSVLGSVTINVPADGKVEVRFDGYCIADTNDMIVLAASDTNDWDVNDGNIGVFAHDIDVDKLSFSHTRSYSISAGSKTYYAVGQNYVCTDGSGFASVYGMLTVVYFPDTSNSMLEHAGFDYNGNVRGAPVAVQSVNLNPTVPGKVVVRFDGLCTPDAGDRIYLAASNSASWGPFDGSVYVENDNPAVCVSDIPFSHTRVYSISPGFYTFYAVAENATEMNGSGDIAIYASLTVSFYPDAGNVVVNSMPIFSQAVSLSNGPMDLGMLNLNAMTDGNVLVHFDGICESDTGDRIILAASDTLDYTSGSGSIEIEAWSTNVNENSFAHSTAYAVNAGSHAFHALGDNDFETDGTGDATIYGTLLAIFFPMMNTSVGDDPASSLDINIYPNPSNELATISFNLTGRQYVKIDLYDITGRWIRTLADGNWNAGRRELSFDARNEQAGIYFLKFDLGNSSRTEKLTLIK